MQGDVSTIVDCSTGKAGVECISEDALLHLKSYKYSSVDKSPVSRYILKHYVRLSKRRAQTKS